MNNKEVYFYWSLTGQDSSPSPADYESESRCLLLESESESHLNLPKSDETFQYFVKTTL